MRFHWLAVLQTVKEVWCWHLLSFWWGHREIIVMAESEAGAGTSHGEIRSKGWMLVTYHFKQPGLANTHSPPWGQHQDIHEGSCSPTLLVRPHLQHLFHQISTQGLERSNTQTIADVSLRRFSDASVLVAMPPRTGITFFRMWCVL